MGRGLPVELLQGAYLVPYCALILASAFPSVDGYAGGQGCGQQRQQRPRDLDGMGDACPNCSVYLWCVEVERLHSAIVGSARADF